MATFLPRAARAPVSRCSCSPIPSARSFSISPIVPSHRIVASALLSRPPLILAPLTPLESTYYAYQRTLSRALSKPLETSLDWFFKKGSAAEKSFVQTQEKVDKETGTEGELEKFELAREGIEGKEELRSRENRDQDLKNLERRMDRTLYLVLKKDRKENMWQFPQGGVEANESLLEAAQRELVEETGPNMDVWPVGRAPAGAYVYDFPQAFKSEHSGAKVFFLPMRVIRGQAVPNKKEGLVDFAWLTKEEVKEKVSEDYWSAVEPILSDR
ncbi:large subunit ribosomal protein L46, partial [Phenoliferia sp. Uapishka_3]